MEQAKSAAEQVKIDLETLAPVVDLSAAIGNTQIHDEMDDNVYFDWELGDEKATADALGSAAKVIELTVTNNRVIPNAMEPRAAVAEYDETNESYTLYTSSQNPHLTRLVMAAFMMQIPESKLHVIAPDVGGGFGSKIYIYPEEAVCTWATKKLRRPIKWTADRNEAFLGDAHGRDHINKVKLGLDQNNKIVGLRVDTLANLGAYLSAFAMVTPTYLHGTLLSGCYDIPTIYTNVRAFAQLQSMLMPTEVQDGQKPRTYWSAQWTTQPGRLVWILPSSAGSISSQKMHSHIRPLSPFNMTSAITKHRSTERLK